MRVNKQFIFLLLLLLTQNVCGQSSPQSDTISFFENSPVPDKQRRHILNYTLAGGYTFSMIWLYTQWYKDYEQEAFHYFNDNGEWMQVDKLAHCWNTYTFAKALSHSYRWTGMDQRKAMWYGTGISMLYLTSIEVFDGFSSEWGFSGGDMVANIAGAGIFAGQQLAWNEQRIVLKYSFHQTDYSQYNTELLGKNLSENMLKDYNGLTQWLTINPRSFFKQSKFPKWLSLAVGYGAEGMTGGDENLEAINGEPVPQFERYRQFYLAIDFDLSRIETKSKLLRGIFKTINFIHLPAPTIEWASGRKPVYHLLYF